MSSSLPGTSPTVPEGGKYPSVRWVNSFEAAQHTFIDTYQLPEHTNMEADVIAVDIMRLAGVHLAPGEVRVLPTTVLMKFTGVKHD